MRQFLQRTQAISTGGWGTFNAANSRVTDSLRAFLRQFSPFISIHPPGHSYARCGPWNPGIHLDKLHERPRIFPQHLPHGFLHGAPNRRHLRPAITSARGARRQQAAPAHGPPRGRRALRHHLLLGEGDSGCIEHVYVGGADGSTPDISRHCVTYLHCNGWFVGGQWASETRTEELRLEDALRAFTDDAVTLHHDGYENGDGGSGEVIFDCVAGTVRLEHVDYYTESDCTDTDL